MTRYLRLIILLVLAGCTVMPADIIPALPSDKAVGNCMQTLVLRLASYEVTLTAPLGDRVLLDTDGGVIAVLTEG